MPKRPFSDVLGVGSSNSIQSYRYDVFISFRGFDTRNTFVDHLYAHLTRKGIFAFKDDTRLHKGESISPQLLQAIKDSQVSIVVFSKDYAASKWCLDEMAAIAECRIKLKQIVFPVFYDVDPSHVRKQNGVYENAFLLHTKSPKCDPENVDRWRREMTHLAELAGWDSKYKGYSLCCFTFLFFTSICFLVYLKQVAFGWKQLAHCYQQSYKFVCVSFC